MHNVMCSMSVPSEEAVSKAKGTFKLLLRTLSQWRSPGPTGGNPRNVPVNSLDWPTTPAHLVTYLQIIDADAAGAGWQATATTVLHVDNRRDRSGLEIGFQRSRRNKLGARSCLRKRCSAFAPFDCRFGQLGNTWATAHCAVELPFLFLDQLHQ